MKPKISACGTAQRHVLVCKWHKATGSPANRRAVADLGSVGGDR
jgi:hypothetical protein